jgi:tetratricopeptide (TPR) repeat protein
MQKRILIPATFIGLLFLFAFRYLPKPIGNKPIFISRDQALQNKFIVQCSPDWNHLNGDSLANGISILQGWGNYQWPIVSRNDSARLYFQQGINMYYSFHIIEAMASFKKAEQFDNTNPMIFWAQALAYGPNINDFAYASTPEAYTAAQKALSLSANSGAKEKILIKAMCLRYSADSTVSRASLNQLYTAEMEKGYLNFPKDADIAALYVDAMMLQHPWEYWKHNGEAEPWTPRILEVLEKTLQQSPFHPGANHYYIHSVEASGNPQRALPSADLLSKLMPSVSHMVHMPSHIYIRSGMYTEGTKVNEMSIKGYKEYLAAFPDVANSASLYLIHNLHMQSACAMMGAGYDYSLKSAEASRASFDTSLMSIAAPFGTFLQYVYMTPVITNIRFGKWDEILNAPSIPENYVYANFLNHWARGIAQARKNNISEAKNELAYLQKNMDQPDMLVVMQPFNAPADAGKVAEKLLEGIIAEQQNNLPGAAQFFTKAVKNEDALIYNEPKDWLLPARAYLGAVLLKAGTFSTAVTVFKEDLKENPNNHWSLKGLYESLQKQKMQTAAGLIKKQLDKTIATDDMKNLPVVF